MRIKELLENLPIEDWSTGSAEEEYQIDNYTVNVKIKDKSYLVTVISYDHDSEQLIVEIE